MTFVANSSRCDVILPYIISVLLVAFVTSTIQPIKHQSPIMSHLSSIRLHMHATALCGILTQTGLDVWE